MTWKNSVCMSIGRFAIPNVNNMIIEMEKESESPIDIFYSSTKEILTTINPEYFNQYDDSITGLLLVGLISATENYFRDILGFILTICPDSQAHSAEEKIQLGSLLWSQNNMHNRSAFEFMAFSSGENIKKTFGKFTGYQMNSAGTWVAMLKEYDKLCEFRHAVVHSGHIVAGKNAIKLGLKRTKKIIRVQMTFANLQEAGKVCTALVQVANNELFELLVNRWANDWRKHPSWDATEEELQLATIWRAFLSKRDAGNKAIINAQTKKRLILQVRTSFSL